MLFFENIKLAMTSIRVNKMRSFLTMLGVIIGISSVIAITAIGDGARGLINNEFSSFGKNNAYIMQSEQTSNSSTDPFTDADLEALRARFPNELSYLAPSKGESIGVLVGRKKAKFTITGVGGFYDRYTSINMIHGRMLSDDDVKKARPLIVIPEEAALSLLGKSDAVGASIPLNLAAGNVNATIVGVYRPEKSIFTAMMPSDSFTVYAPYTLWKGGVSAVLDFYVNENYDIGATCKQMIKYISITKKKPEDIYESGDVNSQQSKINGIMGAMSIAIGAIAAISLVVGGIGIMNIMLVSVTERTREIGIRKSLGARTGDILQQFLIESMIVSSIGGLVGTVLGNCIAAVGLRFAGAAIHVNPVVVLLAVGFSAAVGMFFGLYPARKAAMMNPIEALRYE